MAKRPKVAPVNYRVPFSTADPDATRFGPGYNQPRYWGWQFDQPKEMAQIAMLNIKEGLRDEARAWRTDPIGSVKDYGAAAYQMFEPFSSTKEAAGAWKQMSKQPSADNLAEAIGKTGMAGLDWSIVAQPLVKAGKLAKVARLGRY